MALDQKIMELPLTGKAVTVVSDQLLMDPMDADGTFNRSGSFLYQLLEELGLDMQTCQLLVNTCESISNIIMSVKVHS